MSVLGRLRSWFKGLDLLGASKDEKGLPVAPAPTASVRNTEQRVPSNAVAAAPAATASAQGQGASNAQAPQARASATFPAASQQQQPQAVTQPASHNKQAAASGPAAPARAKLTPEQQREEFFAEYGEANRYSILEVVGKGSYGIVCSAVDNFTGEKVAIKKITNVFEHVSDATRILREIKLLRMLKHPDIVKIQHIMLPPNPRDYQDIYVVFELMETDLHQVIKANDDLTPEHHQFFLYQMLRGLKYLHSAKVFHRDLKPKNILANADCKLKICDFGLARPAFDNMPTMVFWTDYVATRWYRAPELCGSFFAKYSPAIDIWGVGCIFAEVLLGRPLFPGKNVVNQLELITDLLGTPSPDVVAKVRNEKARRFLQSMPPKIGVPFSQVFPGVDRKALSLLRAMLSFDPAERPTAEQALQHPYFAGLHNPAREPTTTPVSKLAFDFDRRKLTVEEVRELIYLEILEYHPSALAAYQSGNHPRANFSHPNALENFKRVFMHLESNPGTVLAPGYQGKARQVVAAPAPLPAAGGAVATAAAHQPRQPTHGRDGRWAGTAVANGQGGAVGEQHRSSRPEGRAVAGPCGGQACNAAFGVLSHPMSYDRTCGYGLAGATDSAAAAAMSSRAWPSAELRQRMGDCKGRTAVTGSLVSSGYPAPGGVARGQAAGQHAQGGGTTRQVVSGHSGPMVNAARSAAVVAAQLSSAPEAVGGQRGASCAGCQPRSSNSSSGASSTATITTTTTVTSGMVTAATNTTNGSSSNMVVQRGITSTQEHHTSQLQLSPSAARQANRHTGNGLAADGAHAAGCGLLSPMGRHSLQLHRTSEMDDMDHNIATRVSMPAPAAARAAAPVEPSQQTATASMVTAAQVAMQPDVDAWMLNRHSLPGPACPEGCAPGAAVATRASAHASSDVAAAVAVTAASKERSGGAPVVPSLGLPGSIYGSRSTGISAFGLVGLPTDGVVLSDREREEVYRDSTEELDARLMRVPPQRLYRAASIS